VTTDRFNVDLDSPALYITLLSSLVLVIGVLYIFNESQPNHHGMTPLDVHAFNVPGTAWPGSLFQVGLGLACCRAQH